VFSQFPNGAPPALGFLNFNGGSYFALSLSFLVDFLFTFCIIFFSLYVPKLILIGFCYLIGLDGYLSISSTNDYSLTSSFFFSTGAGATVNVFISGYFLFFAC
jgi:hypothetical protein